LLRVCSSVLTQSTGTAWAGPAAACRARLGCRAYPGMTLCVPRGSSTVLTSGVAVSAVRFWTGPPAGTRHIFGESCTTARATTISTGHTAKKWLLPGVPEDQGMVSAARDRLARTMARRYANQVQRATRSEQRRLEPGSRGLRARQVPGGTPAGSFGRCRLGRFVEVLAGAVDVGSHIRYGSLGIACDHRVDDRVVLIP
jgi:hypothetical protein